MSLTQSIGEMRSQAALEMERMPEFYSFAELASRWRVSRPALYNILRGHPVIDFAPAPGRRGHKIVSAEVVHQIERDRQRVMR